MKPHEGYVRGKKPFPAACLDYIGTEPLKGVKVIWESPRIFTIEGDYPEYIVAFRRLLQAIGRMQKSMLNPVAVPSADKSSPESGEAVTDSKANFPRPTASSRTGSALQNSPCHRLQATPDLGQI